jgi:hypothetical protein
VIDLGRHVYIREGRLAHRKGKVISHLKGTVGQLHLVCLFNDAGELGEEQACIPEAYLQTMVYSGPLSVR